MESHGNPVDTQRWALPDQRLARRGRPGRRTHSSTLDESFALLGRYLLARSTDDTDQQPAISPATPQTRAA